MKKLHSLFILALMMALVLPLAPTPPALAAGQLSQPVAPAENLPARPDLPEGLSDGDWATMQELIRQAEYYPTWHQPSDAYTAPNRGQGWRVAFGTDGTQITPRVPSPSQEEGQGGGWSWDLTLTGYGYKGHLQTLSSQPDITIDDNRVVYQWDDDLTEWYVNDERGLEQGFTIAAPPPGADGLLQLEMAYGGNLTPRLANGSQAILFQDAAGQTILRYSDLYVHDATGRQLPAHLELRNQVFAKNLVSIVVDDTNATYPLTIDPLVTSQVAKLTASDGVKDDWFGRSVAISGDTVVVGAR